MTRIALHGSGGNLLVQGSIGTQQQLLAGLSAGVEGTAHLHATEGTVGQVSAVFTGKRNTLCHALVDNGGTYLCQTIHVGFAGTIVTTFDGVVEQTVNGVVVVLVVFGSVDTTLGGDGVRPAGGVADAEDLDVVTHLTQRRSCRSAAKTSTYHNHFQFPFVVRRNNPDFCFTLGPFFFERSVRNLGNKFRIGHIVNNCIC